MADIRQNRMTLPGFTSKASFSISTEESNGIIQPFMKNLQFNRGSSVAAGPENFCDNDCKYCWPKNCCYVGNGHCSCC